MINRLSQCYFTKSLSQKCFIHNYGTFNSFFQTSCFICWLLPSHCHFCRMQRRKTGYLKEKTILGRKLYEELPVQETLFFGKSLHTIEALLFCLFITLYSAYLSIFRRKIQEFLMLFRSLFKILGLRVKCRCHMHGSERWLQGR